MLRLLAALGGCTALIAAEPVHPQLPFELEQLTLIDEVDLGAAEPGHRFTDFPAGAAVRKQILGRPALSLPVPGDLKYVAVRLGEGQGLEAGGRYILAVDFLEDQPRSFVITNAGCETRRGVHTGTTVGDAMEAPYVGSHSESIAYPLAGGWRTWIQTFRLQPRFPEGLPSGGVYRSQRAEDGIPVVVSQFAATHSPLSQGAAVGTIRLYAAPADHDLAAALAELPEDLPQRHLFWREEMSDGVIGSRKPAENGYPEGQELDWYRAKIELLQFLGMNTFSKDLLEFGHNQGWDSSRYGGNDWVYQNHQPQRWTQILGALEETGLWVLPYYEYQGSIGQHSLGRERRSRTLHQRAKGKDGADDYTHIWWSEKANADLTDPETFEDFRRMLEITVADEKARVPFVGVWLRPRNSGLPVSFSERCIALFNQETGRTVSRSDLQQTGEAYAAYWDWWLGKREAFFNQLRDYLQQELGEDATLLFTADPSELGRGIGRQAVVSDDPGRFFAGREVLDFEAVVAAKLHHQAQLARTGTWGGWEWEHSVPPADPQRYHANPGVAITYGFNSLASTSNPAGLQDFRSAAGLAMVRHFHLNENTMWIDGKKDQAPLGYFVTDMELSGPYSVLAEARALANGDPRFIGYLSSHNYNRGFPQYVRAFNRAFLALPAIPSQRLDQAASHDAVVVRRYVSPEHGSWYAVINTGLTDATDVRLTLPESGLVDCLSGEAVTPVVSLYPGQVLAWRTP